MYLKQRITYLVLAAFFLCTGIYIGIAPARGLLFLTLETATLPARIVSGDPGSKARENRPIDYEYMSTAGLQRSRWHYPDQETDGGKSGRVGKLAFTDPAERSQVLVTVVNSMPSVSCLVLEFSYGKILWNSIVALGLMLLGLGALCVAFLKADYFK
jgi:hypothetical protein